MPSFCEIWKEKSAFYTHNNVLLSAKVAGKQMEGDEIPKEHLNQLRFRSQHTAYTGRLQPYAWDPTRAHFCPTMLRSTRT